MAKCYYQVKKRCHCFLEFFLNFETLLRNVILQFFIVKCSSSYSKNTGMLIIIVRLLHCFLIHSLVYLQDMNILKDYIAYARSYVNPKLSEEAAQYLIQAYVGKKFQQFRDMRRHSGAVVG